MTFAIGKHSSSSVHNQVVSPTLTPDGVARRGQPPDNGGDVLTHAHISPLPYSLPCTTPVTYTEYGKRLASVWLLGQRVYSGGSEGVAPLKPYKASGKPRKRAEGGNLQCWVDGSLIKVSKPSGSVPKAGGGKRNIILGFSRGARRRILQKMAMLIRAILPIFVTLTYPSEFSTDYTQWKKHLDTWCKRLHRRCPSAGLIWRLEAQKRGAPHYHLLIFGMDLTPEVRQWIATSWFEVVASGDEKHLTYGTDCQGVRSARGVRAYVGKYIAKVQAPIEDCGVDWSKVGRWWGVRYAENLPWSEVIGGDGLTYREAAVLMRYLRRYLKGQGVKVNGSLPGMSVYVNEPKRWMEVLDRLLEGAT